MKKITLFFMVVVAIAKLHGQGYYDITFTGSGAAPETVLVENITKGISANLQGTDVLRLNLVTSVQQIAPENYKLSIYPNPMDHSCHFEFQNTQHGRVNIQLYSIDGRVIHTFSREMQYGKHQFTLSGVAAGAYIINVTTPVGKISGRFVATGQTQSDLSLLPTGESSLTGVADPITSASQNPTTTLKTNKTIVNMDYTLGDQLKFIAYANGFANTSVITSPSGSQTITFSFSSLPNIKVSQYEAVLLQFDSGQITNEEYNATLGGKALELAKLNDTILVMIVPLLIPGNYSLDIEGLGFYANNFEVIIEELTDTPDNILNTLSTGLADFQASLPDTSAFNVQMLAYINAFNSMIDTASTEEKEQLALLYQTNSELFDEILYGNNKDGNKNLSLYLTADNVILGISVGVFVLSAILTAKLGAALQYGQALVAGAVATAAAITANKYRKKFTETHGNIYDIIVSPFQNSEKTALSFTSGEQKELILQTENRSLIPEDENVSIQGLIAFFSSFNKFNAAIDKLNSSIVFINANVPLVDIPLFPNVELEPLDIETYDTPFEAFQNFTFSVSNPNVSLVTSFSSPGKILLTLTVDEDYEYTEPIQTRINARYQDDFNDITRSFDVSVSAPLGCGEVTFFYNGQQVTYGTVESATGRCWLDRNLGASQIATSSTDALSYGDLFQWGRSADGHQVRTSGTTSTLSNSNTPGHGLFIITSSGNWDWRNPQNNNLWQGVNGTNNPCPAGYRLPTEAELNAERQSWSSNNAAGAFASPLKLPAAGFRSSSVGSLGYVGYYGFYWSSTVGGTHSQSLYFDFRYAGMFSDRRADGFSVRCLKD